MSMLTSALLYLCGVINCGFTPGDDPNYYDVFASFGKSFPPQAPAEPGPNDVGVCTTAVDRDYVHCDYIDDKCGILAITYADALWQQAVEKYSKVQVTSRVECEGVEGPGPRLSPRVEYMGCPIECEVEVYTYGVFKKLSE